MCAYADPSSTESCLAVINKLTTQEALNYDLQLNKLRRNAVLAYVLTKL